MIAEKFEKKLTQCVGKTEQPKVTLAAYTISECGGCTGGGNC